MSTLTPKEVHTELRGRSRPCPCCGQPLLVLVEGPPHTEAAAREFARLMQWLQDNGASIGMQALEDAAEEVLSGRGEMV